MDGNAGVGVHTPQDVIFELLRGSFRITSILVGAVIVQVTALAWVMTGLAHDYGIEFHATPALWRCAGFAVLATTAAMAAARLLLGRRLSALMTVAVLAGWSLLPGTLLLAWVSAYGGPILMLLALTPLFLALLGFAAIAAGARVTGAVLLVTAMMLVATIACARPVAPGNPAWVAIAGWFTALSVATALAAKAGRSRQLA